MTEILTAEQLERVRDNEQPRCTGCGVVARRERDGINHWHHQADCPVMQRIREATEPPA